MSLEMIDGSIESLFRYVKGEDYCGWDPYDGLNCRMAAGLPGALPKILAIQFNRISPINLRPLLRVGKGQDLKGLALFVQAYSKMYSSTKDDRYLEELDRITPLLEESSLRDRYGMDCWASHYFPYIASDKNKLDLVSPDIIGTSQAIIALVNAYRQTGRPQLKEMALSAGESLMEKFLVRSESETFFKYTPTENDKVVVNASAQGLEAASHILEIGDDEGIRSRCEEVKDFLIRNQSEDGSWIYSIYKNGNMRRQLDFHQGFIIDGLLSFLPYSDSRDEMLSCIEKGAEYYRERLFLNDGTSYYRYPTRYPVDIHNQAQGIISFAKMSSLEPSYLEFAEEIAGWTILQMQCEPGYFCYQKWPLLSNKIPYMRWGQAWMMLSLATLREQLLKKVTVDETILFSSR